MVQKLIPKLTPEVEETNDIRINKGVETFLQESENPKNHVNAVWTKTIKNKINDKDLKSVPTNKEIEKISWSNFFYYKIISSLSNIFRPYVLLVQLSTFLMLPKYGFKDDAGEHGKNIDSGIDSNIAEPVIYDPSSNLEVDSPPQWETNPSGSRDILNVVRVSQHVPGGPQAEHVPRGPPAEHVPVGPQAEHVPRGPPAEHVPRGPPAEYMPRGPPAEHVPRGPPAEYVPRGPPAEHVPRGPPAEYVPRGPPAEHVPRGLPVPYLWPRIFSDVRSGSSKELSLFAGHLKNVPVNSGMFLDEFVPLYDIRNGDHFTFDQDYIQVGQFTGRDVRLCKTVTTNHLFVTKWVPFEEVRNVRCLRHPQQVELVLGLQDWFSGVAKIDGIIKRTFRGQEFAEIFIEYCHGGTFRDNIDHLRSLTLTAKWRLSKDVLRVLQDLHFQTIIHGDLKAENICFRGNDVVLIDFESARHPKYQNSTRVTVLYLPPWMRLCWNTRDFDLLKTIDMWAVGMVLLDVVFDQLLWAREYSQLLNTVCDACNVKLKSCQHFQSKLLLMMECRYPEAILPYLPEVQPDDDPVRKRLALLIHGLLPLSGPEAQFTASLASEALEDTKILVKIVKNGIATIPPLVIHKGIKFQKMLEMDDIKKLKKNHPDLGEGMWFTYETRATDGEVKEYCVQKNQALEESCILHVYPPMKPTS